jgi:hypothetical protein
MEKKTFAKKTSEKTLPCRLGDCMWLHRWCLLLRAVLRGTQLPEKKLELAFITHTPFELYSFLPLYIHLTDS